MLLNRLERMKGLFAILIATACLSIASDVTATVSRVNLRFRRIQIRFIKSAISRKTSLKLKTGANHYGCISCQVRPLQRITP